MRLARYLAAAALAGLLAGCSGKPEAFKSIDITGVQGYGTDFRLTDPAGKERTLSEFRGKVVAIFFGYTHCPDVCPTTLADLREVMTRLGTDGDKLQVVFISVDPKRDTPDVLGRYVPSFHPRFLGLTGSPEAVASAARDFKIFVREQPGKSPESYTVDHTAGTLVFDGQGRLRLFMNYGATPEDMASDFKRLMKEGQ